MASFEYNRAWGVILPVLFLISSNSPSWVLGAPQVPCYFIYGDSLADNGNNNNLETQAKANYPPYGIDFPDKATGRFTNGHTSIDIIAGLLGFDRYIQPFASAKGSEILIGVNYASGGAGIRDETGQQLKMTSFFGVRLKLKNELNSIFHLFEEQKFLTEDLNTITEGPSTAFVDLSLRVRIRDPMSGIQAWPLWTYLLHALPTGRSNKLEPSIAKPFGHNLARQRHVGIECYGILKRVHIHGMGSNDYINNYFMPDVYQTGKLYMPEQYADVLIKQYQQQLKTLYSYGARKVAIFGLSVIGCAPTKISRFGTNGSLCVDKINSAVMLLNDRLKPLVDELNRNLADAKFTYIDFFGIAIAGLPVLRVASSTCCKVRESGLCIPFETPCSIRLLHAFYDGFHPTEIVNLVFGARAYTALLSSDAYPFDIHHLAMI
ncbi:LOW QUALITY PROTEIN: hypothetical protein EUGRSUZ_C00135 [Eucalyptus grandis]|uniref:Uncharacterized protein n=1 Tax=Eucalyptus grandis TaxID=71139 RepID=A0ACC3L9N1_EUCGR|nr:LOW QUALITY PROTEIN: hypothetical protein EUGRSUZ_C00135 [Eucalyptus grandis]